jgi:hypothetical protein
MNALPARDAADLIQYRLIKRPEPTVEFQPKANWYGT